MPETPEEIYLPGYQPTYKPNYLQIQKAIQAISLAKKPLILAGAGVLFADAREELTEFVEKYKFLLLIHCLVLEVFMGNMNCSLVWQVCTEL